MTLCLALLASLPTKAQLAAGALSADTLTHLPVRNPNQGSAGSAKVGLQEIQDTLRLAGKVDRTRQAVVDEQGDTVKFTAADSLQLNTPSAQHAERLGGIKVFNPDPHRALWLSALCPGLGQIYNRRYWKLPIVVGAFVGLGYGTSWNNRMFKDYSKAYRDLTDNDPSTKSYMDFFPPTVKEGDLDKEWLKKSLKNKKNYYRRYREVCTFSLVGIYLINIIDAYVDASLAHFDVSPDLSMRVEPAVLDSPALNLLAPSLGMKLAIHF